MIKLVRIGALLAALAFVVLVVFDHDPKLDLRIGRNAFRAGDMDSAIRLARIAALLSASDSSEWAHAHILQAEAALKMKRPDRALAMLGRLLAVQPNNPGGLRLRGRLKLATGDSAGALADLKQSQNQAETGSEKLRKSDAPDIARRGQAFLETGDLAAALKDADTAYRLDPKNPQVLYTRSLVLEKQGQFLPALEAMEWAIYTINRRDRSFMMSEEGKSWLFRLVSLRKKAKVPKDRPYVPVRQ